MARLFAITLFASAFLLFWVQPLVAKMLLPYLGGSPGVWNVSMCFFQGALLVGYAWAHWLTGLASIRRQLFIQLGTLVVAGLVLPFAVPDEAVRQLAGGADPSVWLLLQLGVICGLPFVLLSANSPLLQRWFGRTGETRSADPYFLFAASNAGSLLALIAFPLAFEPMLRLAQQAWCWAAGYGVFLTLMAACAWKLRDVPVDQQPAASAGPSTELKEAPVVKMGWRRRLHWFGLAFIPSSLMLGVTQYLTTDVATLPLLWVIPLAVYLLTFVFAFGPWTWASRVWLNRLLPILALGVLFTVISGVNDPIWALFPLHLVFLLVAGLVAHGRLAAARPPVTSLTEFYFWMSLGGVAGGIFNGLIAPVAFDRVLEYPLVMVLVAALAPWRIKPVSKPTRGRIAWLVAAGMGALTLGFAMAMQRWGSGSVQLTNWVALGVPCVIAYLLVDHPRRFALALLSILLCGSQLEISRGQTLARERDFFGVSRVQVSRDGQFHELYHGSTIHGRQFIEPNRQRYPLSYYHRTGPLRQIVDAFEKREAPRRVAVIGLGAGAMAAYAKAGQEWTFYEIDPVVIRLAQDTNYFTYLADCRADRVEIIPGDARLQLANAPDGHYGLIVLDAFSSDAVPVHLITREAMQLYLAKLTPEGVLGFHVSNRNLSVKSVAGAVALDAGLYCIEKDEDEMGDVEIRFGKDPSQWMMAARQASGLEELVRPSYWHESRPPAGRVWTDDYSSVWGLLR